MANQRIRGASEWLKAVVAGERQHASHALQVAMGTLFILNLHLPREIIAAVTAIVTFTRCPLTEIRSVSSARRYLCRYVQVQPRLSAHGRRAEPSVGLLSLPPLLHLLQLRLLVAVLQVLHEDGHDHVDQHELGRQDEGDKVNRGDDGEVAEAVAVLRSAISQRILHDGGRGGACIAFFMQKFRRLSKIKQFKVIFRCVNAARCTFCLLQQKEILL